MKEKMPFLLIPLVNEVFGTDYKAEDIVTHTADTHMTQLGKRITDACTYIRNRCYHIACQSNPDNTIAIRMFEYEYIVPVIRLQDYTLSDIWEKQLYIMLPFYLLRYEKWLSEESKDEDVKECLLSDCREMYDRLYRQSAEEVSNREGIPTAEMDELIKEGRFAELELAVADK